MMLQRMGGNQENCLAVCTKFCESTLEQWFGVAVHSMDGCMA